MWSKIKWRVAEKNVMFHLNEIKTLSEKNSTITANDLDKRCKHV